MRLYAEYRISIVDGHEIYSHTIDVDYERKNQVVKARVVDGKYKDKIDDREKHVMSLIPFVSPRIGKIVDAAESLVEEMKEAIRYRSARDID